MGNLTTARAVALTIAVAYAPLAGAAESLPSKVAYTFYARGERVGRSEVRITRGAEALRFASKVWVSNGEAVIELSTRTEADPRTYALRSFAYEGSKGGTTVAASVTVRADSVFGFVAMGGSRESRRARVAPTPAVVWEDWVMELEILLALQQERAFKTASTRGLLLAGSYSAAQVTLGYTGEAVVESSNRSMTTRKLLVAIEGGEPFESFVDPKRGVPVYIHFPGIRAEVFLDDFFGDNPVSRYSPPTDAPKRP